MKITRKGSEYMMERKPIENQFAMCVKMKHIQSNIQSKRTRNLIGCGDQQKGRKRKRSD